MKGLGWIFTVSLIAVGGNALIYYGGNKTMVERIEQKFTIVPGTRWCGDGNVARNYDDLGVFRHTDYCCREHDHCPSIIKAGETLNNLTNNGYYTRSNCSCDIKFHECLENVGFPEFMKARKVGRLYFYKLRPQCFSNDYPIVSCAEYGRFKFGKSRKCVKYNLDTKGVKKLQWFDGPDW